MPTVLFDNHSWSQLLEERRQRAEGTSAPLRWHELIDEISRELTGSPTAPWALRHAFSRRSPLIAWLPSLAAIVTAVTGRGALIYLCWGIAPYTGVKRMVLQFIMTRARYLLVNEEVTRGEIRAATGRTARLIPFFVDTDYFSYRGMNGRKAFLFCAGSNDRNPEVLLGLAERGHDVVWLVNDPNLWAIYANRHSRLQLCSRIPYESLRELYQTCAAVVLPVERDLHAAGQTTGLEALACGSPLLISQCRAADIFAAMPTVGVEESNDPAAWSRAVLELGEAVAKQPSLTDSVALTVRKDFSHESVKRVLAEYLIGASDEKATENCAM